MPRRITPKFNLNLAIALIDEVMITGNQLNIKYGAENFSKNAVDQNFFNDRKKFNCKCLLRFISQGALHRIQDPLDAFYAAFFVVALEGKRGPSQDAAAFKYRRSIPSCDASYRSYDSFNSTFMLVERSLMCQQIVPPAIPQRVQWSP